MSAVNWRKWFRIIHRDLGYLFFGLAIAYGSSGLALDHLRDWNPNYSISRREIQLPPAGADAPFTKDDAKKLLADIQVDGAYQSHYRPVDGELKIFFQGGSVVIAQSTGKAVVETMKKRPLLNTFNRLHYNPGRWWTWFADGFCIALLVMAITGLFMLKGYQGITRRGGVLVLIGILIPTFIVLHCL
ncbi:MAG: PepSY-associated TM helix domain-containing protein [Verrucomicrobiae bacterium]|nr:PepSY-associated TM helix domain-containing protein [Verrucomicrobiae bacterium]